MRLRYLQHVIQPDQPEKLPLPLPAWMDGIKAFCAFWFSDQQEWATETSGSTGKARSILLSREQIAFSAQASLNYFQLDSSLHGMALALPARSAGGFMLMARAFTGNLDLLLLPPEGFASRSMKFPSDRSWFLPLLPNQFFDFLQRSDAVKVSGNLCAILLGGGPVDAGLQEAIAQLKCPVFHSYGMTETASHIALRKIHPEEAAHGFRLLPGVSIRLDAEGCLEIFSSKLTNGQWLRTHDRAEILENGRFLILGRADFTINSGGLKIQPEAEKTKLLSMLPDSCRNFDLLGMPDERLGEKLVLVSYGRPEAAGQIYTIIRNLADTAQRKRLPKAIYSLPQGPPRLPGGKTDFSGLRKKIQEILPFRPEKL